MSSFLRPVGASADVNELEYISALHQTDVLGGIRKDGTIQDVDISLFLASRHGVELTPEQVRERILEGMGCKDGFLDMMQLVTLLLMPILREEQEKRDETEDDESSKDHDDLLQYTLEMMLHDVTGSREPKPLNRTLVKQIFQAYGETGLSENDALVDEMLRQAGVTDPEARRTGVMLDPDTFCRALTHDVQDYDTKWKNKYSTNYDDVFDTSTSAAITPNDTYDTTTTSNDGVDIESPVEGGNEDKEKLSGEITKPPKIYTAPHLDSVADTFRSRPLVVFMWTFFVISFLTYLNTRVNVDFLPECPSFQIASSWTENAGSFFCILGRSVFRWLFVMVIMSIFGFIFFGFAGIGNFIECKDPRYPLAGVVISAFCTWLPAWLYGRRTEGSAPQEFLEVATYALGGIVVLLSLWQVTQLLIPIDCFLYRWLKCILIPEAIRTERRNKQAADHKIDGMVQNALEIHRVKKQETVVPTHFGQALLNFAETIPKFETVGSFAWTWRMVYSTSLFRKEGVIFSARLLSINFTQFIVTIFVFIGGIVVTSLAKNEYEEQKQLLIDFFESIQLNADIIAWFPLREHMVVIPLSIGTAFAFITGLAISLAVIPSATATTVKLRCGLIPFAHYKKTKSLTIAPDQTAYLRGIMFWGTLLASIIMGGTIAFLIFLFLWQVTAAVAQRLTASILGAVLVLLIHKIIVLSFRKETSKAYYRRQPAKANAVLLTRECGLIPLTQGSVIIRILKLLFVAILYMGRVDTPFLHDGVGEIERVGFRFDNDPYVFMVDILQHEAHRHPYIETLGVMYLMKIRYGERFCSEAGSSWRLIFVCVLMPWLSKYRATRRSGATQVEEDEDNDDDVGVTAPPLRAVSLVDARGYALRAASLVPVASGWAGQSTFGVSSRRQQDNDNDNQDVRALREEVRRLRFQLRILERTQPSSPPSLLHEEQVPQSHGVYERRTVSPPPSSPRRFYPDMEYGDDEMDEALPPEFRRQHGLGSPTIMEEDDEEAIPPPPVLRRNYSEGLEEMSMDDSRLPPPAWKRDTTGTASVSWKNFEV